METEILTTRAATRIVDVPEKEETNQATIGTEWEVVSVRRNNGIQATS